MGYIKHIIVGVWSIERSERQPFKGKKTVLNVHSIPQYSVMTKSLGSLEDYLELNPDSNV